MVQLKSNFLINFIELKLRVCYYIYSLIFSFLICFNYKTALFYLISDYFLKYESGFIYTSLLDPILIYLKLSGLFSFFISLPIFGYIFGFFFLKSFATSYLIYFIFYFLVIYFASLLLLMFLSSLILPILFEFLLSFQHIDLAGGYELVLKATITQYYSLFFNYIYLFCFLILIPNLYLIFVFLGIIHRDNFINFKFRKYLYIVTLFFFIVFAPPDI